MANNTPPGFEDSAFLEDLLYSPIEETDDLYLIGERPYLKHLDTEDKNFEQE